MVIVRWYHLPPHSWAVALGCGGFTLRKGQRHTEEAKAALRASRIAQGNPKLALLGFDKEAQDAAEASGLRWCTGHKAFVPKETFYTEKFGASCGPCTKAYVQRRRDRMTVDEKQIAAAVISDWRVTAGQDTIRASWMRKKYGVTPEWYDEKLKEQDGHCALCPALVDERKLAPQAIVSQRKYLLVDHSHETGQARGLLCAKCNTALHRVEYQPGWAHAALAYLARYA